MNKIDLAIRCEDGHSHWNDGSRRVSHGRSHVLYCDLGGGLGSRRAGANLYLTTNSIELLPMSAQGRFGARLRDEKYFARFWLLVVGIPISVLLLFVLGASGGPGWWVILVGLGFAIAKISGHIYWKVYASQFTNQKET